MSQYALQGKFTGSLLLFSNKPGHFWISCQLFADDIALLASSVAGLQLKVGMRISFSKSKPMVLDRKGLKVSGVLFQSEEAEGRQTDLCSICIDADAAQIHCGEVS